MKLKEILETTYWDVFDSAKEDLGLTGPMNTWSQEEKIAHAKKTREITQKLAGNQFKNLHTSKKARQAASIVRKYTDNYKITKTLEPAVEYLLKSAQNRYDGKMVRGIIVNHKEVLNAADIRSLTSKIHQYDDTSIKYKSWSKNTNGMLSALDNNTEGGMYDKIDKQYPIAVVVQQTGIALDIEKAMGDRNTFDTDEEELLAEYQGTAHVVGFAMDSQFWPVEQFKEFIGEVRSRVRE